MHRFLFTLAILSGLLTSPARAEATKPGADIPELARLIEVLRGRNGRINLVSTPLDAN